MDTHRHSGKVLCSFREQLKVSKSEMARRMSVQRATVQQTEQAEDVRCSTVVRYAHALGIRATDIFEIIAKEEPQQLPQEEPQK